MSDATRQKILDAALNSFSEKPFDAVSLRSLVAAAGVNQAAINYHFRSKLGVYDMLLDDIAGEVTKLQIDALKNAGSTVEDILSAYITPFLTYAQDKDKQAHFVARFFQEPAAFVKERLPRTFGDTQTKFAKALQKAGADLDAKDTAFALSQVNYGLMSALANPVGDEVLGKSLNDKDPSANVERLVSFFAAALGSRAATVDASQPDLFG